MIIVKLKQHKCCKECPSCMDLFQNGNYYCNIKVNDPNINKETDISCFIVDPDNKLDDCPWDIISETVETFSREDQIGLKCMAKMFGGKDNNFFEDDPPCEMCKNNEVIMYANKNPYDNPIPYIAKFCPECGRFLNK